MSSRPKMMAGLMLGVAIAMFLAAMSHTLAKAQMLGDCRDKDFASGMVKDWNALGVSVDFTKADVLSNAVLQLASLRHKYEDVTAPTGCEAAKTYLLVILANTSDLETAYLAEFADPANKATYDTAARSQLARNGLLNSEFMLYIPSELRSTAASTAVATQGS